MLGRINLYRTSAEVVVERLTNWNQDEDPSLDAQEKSPGEEADRGWKLLDDKMPSVLNLK